MTQPSRIRISVIIPALNEQGTVARAIRSAWEAGAEQVIVADGGSSDSTAEVAAAEDATVTTSAAGRAIQQNQAALSATGDLLVFLHADSALQSGSLEPLRAMMAGDAGRQVVFGGFRQRIEASGILFRLLEWGNHFRATWLGLVYGDQAIFVDRCTFERVGRFPELPLMEDYVLSRTLRRETWPQMLPGPVFTSPRRWQRHGILRQTLRNWWIILRFHLGVPPERLAPSYRRHDRPA